MAFDGIFTGKIANELNIAVDAHIDKIYQPSSSELCLVLRKKGFVKRLLLSVKSGMQRVHFTEMKLENPEKPPMFCMLARKYFSAARLIGVNQIGFERIIIFTFSATNELGDRITNKIVCELIGNKSNIVLVDENEKIIDAIRRSDISSDARLIQPGATYTLPEPQDKCDLYLTDTNRLIEKINGNKELPLSKAILSAIGGMSPIVAREISYKSKLFDKTPNEISDFSRVAEQIDILKEKNDIPFMLLDGEKPSEFCYTDISQYGELYTKKTFNSFSELLDAYYLERERVSVRSRVTGEVTKTVSNLISRANKRLANRQNELKECESRDNLRICGELIKANLGAIKAGQRSIVVKNYYDENLSEIEIKLDPALSGANNAAKYFKEYKKKNVAAGALGDFIIQDKKEIEYLESVLDSLSRCESVADLREIKEELRIGGFISKNSAEKSKSKNSSYKEYTSKEGYRIIVGKNNLQNDYITLKLASKNDLWFHTKNIHGSHIVLFSGGKDVSDETLVFAATLAAKNSKASDSSKVPVDYTQIKNVKKPSGAKPGMVIYTANKTLFVTP